MCLSFKRGADRPTEGAPQSVVPESYVSTIHVTDNPSSTPITVRPSIGRNGSKVAAIFDSSESKTIESEHHRVSVQLWNFVVFLRRYNLGFVT